ncbi:PREDICTED: probable cytochrome P450 6t1 [Rhagoletis zephyria]|uniref:probable cytochrome P450 6t1 n=1 Tax=Rhagoletis zephyria TaxID=28612 RepID=UPI00081181D7|nr:PREDICTED: probable cytochrome P450 6t1 [Rhagoletis zephyria]
MFSLCLSLCLCLIVAVYIWLRQHFRYWQVRGLPQIPPTLIAGNVFDLLRYRCCFGEQFQSLYDHPAASGHDFVGIHVLHNHALLLRDPALIKRVLVSDFSAFASRFERTDADGDAMGSLNLFFAQYEVWTEIHQIFSPLFSHGKAKQMYPLLQQVGNKLEEHMAALSFDQKTQSVIVEVKELSALFTTDVIASLAFGIEANSLANPQAEFRRMCIEVNEPRFKRVLHLFTIFFMPQWVELISAHLYSPEYEKFMRSSIEYVIEERTRNGAQRNDLIDIFIALKREAAGSSNESVVQKRDFFVAQAAFLLLAGFDTSSSTITFALYELAKQPEIQRRLRAELLEALTKGNGSVNYDTINALPYLRMIVDEVLRLYPPTSFLDRRCTAELGYEIDHQSGYCIPQGTPVYISVLGLHRDERYWPNPLEFDPERFSAENRKLHTPMSYLPFGAGPRSCIGTLLGMLEVKTGLVHILKNFRVETCSLTAPEMKFEAKAFVLAPDGGTYLRFVKDKLF